MKQTSFDPFAPGPTARGIWVMYHEEVRQQMLKTKKTDRYWIDLTKIDITGN